MAQGKRDCSSRSALSERCAPHKESRNVAELREKIKIFLASQGMIKGHSGTAPRGAESESPTLHLRTEEYSESSESPPTPTLSLTDTTRPHHMISSIRDDPYSVTEYAVASSWLPSPIFLDFNTYMF